MPWNNTVVGRMHTLIASNCNTSRWLGLGQLGCYWRTMPMVLLEMDLDMRHLVDCMQDVRQVVTALGPGCLPSLLGFTMRFGGCVFCRNNSYAN